MSLLGGGNSYNDVDQDQMKKYRQILAEEREEEYRFKHKRRYNDKPYKAKVKNNYSKTTSNNSINNYYKEKKEEENVVNNDYVDYSNVSYNEDDYDSFNKINVDVFENENDYEDMQKEYNTYKTTTTKTTTTTYQSFDDDDDEEEESSFFTLLDSGYKWFVVITTILSGIVVLYLLFTLKIAYLFLYILILLTCFMLGYILMFVLHYFIN